MRKEFVTLSPERLTCKEVVRFESDPIHDVRNFNQLLYSLRAPFFYLESVKIFFIWTLTHGNLHQRVVPQRLAAHQKTSGLQMSLIFHSHQGKRCCSSFYHRYRDCSPNRVRKKSCKHQMMAINSFIGAMAAMAVTDQPLSLIYPRSAVQHVVGVTTPPRTAACSRTYWATIVFSLFLDAIPRLWRFFSFRDFMWIS